jgi:hypothetical protein
MEYVLKESYRSGMPKYSINFRVFGSSRHGSSQATLETNKEIRYLYLLTLETKRFLLNYNFTILLFLLHTIC